MTKFTSTDNEVLPLFVDLDGTLIKTDLMFESVCVLLKRNPFNLVTMAIWLFKGKAYLKARLAERVDLSFSGWPFNEEFLDFLNDEKRTGRQLVLISAANERALKKFAEPLQLFETCVGSDEQINLKAAAKRQRIELFTRGKPFSYAGNSRADVPVWEAAAEVIRVNCSSPLARDLCDTKPSRDFDLPGSKVRYLWQAMRPHQWAKNGLLFIPLTLAHQISDAHRLLHTFIGFICFCLVASSVYLSNDLMDLESDRLHSTKKTRPLAAGTLPIQTGMVAAIFLLLAAFALAQLQTREFVVILLGYWMLAVLYSVLLKRLFLLDLVTLASLYSLRIEAGAQAAQVNASIWLLGFSMSLFFGLAALKRVVELSKSTHAAALPGRAYNRGDLTALTAQGMFACACSVLIFIFYIYAVETRALYRSPERLWPIAGLLGGILFRAWWLARQGTLNEDPVLLAVSDRPSQVATALMFVVLWFAI